MPRNKIFNDKKQIIDVALSIIEKEGLESVSMRRLSKEMGVSSMTLYNYVRNTDDILREILILNFNKLYEMVYSLMSDMAKEGHLGLKAYYTIVIAAIGNDPGTSQKHIMENVPFNKARVSIIVSELMEMGYVTDVSKGKSSSLFLTEEGKDIYEISSEIFMLYHEALLSAFSEEEREVLHRMMIKMDEVLDDMLS